MVVARDQLGQRLKIWRVSSIHFATRLRFSAADVGSMTILVCSGARSVATMSLARKADGSLLARGDCNTRRIAALASAF